MPVYVTISDGERYEAKDALDFVKQLKDSSRGAEGQTLNQFMRTAAARAEQASGFKMHKSSVSAEMFLEDLLRAGLVKEVVPEQKAAV